MNLWNRFKFELLRWLLGDICCKSDCENCIMRTPVVIRGIEQDIDLGMGCEEQYVFYQARKVWRIE